MPSGHSGSSHSGGGFSGGSRSFSSHSSGSSFRSSPSSHSYSSRSSGSSYRSSSSSSSFRSSPSSRSSGPSGHSGSSHSSFNSFGSGSRPATYGRPSVSTARPAAPVMSVQRRPRVNQPVIRMGISPLRTIYCLNHDYAYYPSSWVGEDGTSYKAGYYDENGQYYSNVKVDNATEDLPAVLTCEYCGTETKYKWTEGTIPNCPNCGAPLKVNEAPTDTVVSSSGSSADSSYSNQTQSSSGSSYTSPSRKKKGSLIVTIVCVILGISIINSCTSSFAGSSGYGGSSYSSTGSSYSSSYSGSSSSGGLTVYDSSEDYQQAQQSQQFQAVTDQYLKLSYQSGGVYDYATSESDCDKTLKWSSQDDAYYDQQTGFWLWYNENSDTWQYWIEGASEQFGDYGWMECEGSKWYVEVSSGNWQEYTGDTSNFWHVKNSFD